MYLLCTSSKCFFTKKLLIYSYFQTFLVPTALNIVLYKKIALTGFFEILVHFQTFRSLNYDRSSFRAKRGMHGNMTNSSKFLKKFSFDIVFQNYNQKI